MIEVNKNRTKTDEAWERLYARLDEDNLLAGAGDVYKRQTLFLPPFSCFIGVEPGSMILLRFSTG